MSAFDFIKIRKSVEDLQAHLRKLRAEQARLQAERDMIAKAPATREDVAVFLSKQIDKKSSDYLRVFHDFLKNLAARPDRLDMLPNARVLTATLPNMAPNAFTVEEAVSAFLGEMMKHSLAAIIKDAPWPADAMPLEERKRRLDELDATLAELSAEENKILIHANQAGLTIY